MSQDGHLRDLKPDPMNARRHTSRNLAMIEDSIQRNGFGRPILISSDNVIAAGNATIDAAASAGLENVRIIDSDGTEVIAIRRTDVSSTSPTFTNLALSDNRAAELATWDADVLTALQQDGADLSAFWYDDELLAVLEQPPDVTFKEYDESVENDVQYCECPSCGHRFPK